MITTIRGFVTKIIKQYHIWNDPPYVWFRGEPSTKTRLTPKLYRLGKNGQSHHENKLLQMFRWKAASFSQLNTPQREQIDQWLFLAQHVGLPTRLLDWTENSLLALYLALQEDQPVVWMLDPMALNNHVSETLSGKSLKYDEFPLTWLHAEPPIINIGNENIRGAWEGGKCGIELPVAVHPTYIHPRMSAQRSVFTVHGFNHDPIDTLIPPSMIIKFEISPRVRKKLLSSLVLFGIQHSTVFPDLDGLAKELSINY
jgi:hypothetical protein